MTTSPKVTLNIEPANIEATAQRRLLVLAQGLGAGFTSGDVYADINNSSDITTLFGAGSHAYIMSKAILDIMDWLGTEIPFDVMPLDDNGAGVDAVGSVAIGVTTAVAGTMKVTVGTKSGVNSEIIDHNTYSVAVGAADANTVIADAIKAAIDADANALVTVVSAGGTATFTTKNAGTIGNDITIIVEDVPDGVTATITAFASGATDPVLTSVLDTIDDERYDIVCPYAFIATVKGHLENKFNVVNNILDGMSFSSKSDTYSDFITATTGLLDPAVNISQTSVIFCNKSVNKTAKKGSALAVFDPTIASIFSIFRALRFIDNALISSFMQSGNTRGGTGLSTIPYFNMIFSMFPIIPVGENFSSTEKTGLGNKGGSYFEMSDNRSDVLSGETETLAYKSAAITAVGKTYRFLNNSDALTTSRGYIFANLKSDYAQARLVDGDLPKNGVGITANQPVIEASIKSYWQILVDNGILQGGSDNETAFDDALNVNIDTANGLISGSFSIRIASQVREFDFDIKTQL